MIIMSTFYIALFLLIQSMPLSTGRDRRKKQQQNKQRQDERSTTRPAISSKGLILR